jgi:hypothetical protein
VLVDTVGVDNMVQVVNIKTTPNFGKVKGDVYIGRYNEDYGKSKWHNPFHITFYTTRDNAIALYEKYLIGTGLINDIYQLKDANRLGCWCKPLPCHGDVLKKYIDEYNKIHGD